MGKLRVLVAAMREAEYSVDTARRLTFLWAGLLLMWVLIISATVILTPERWFSLGFQVVFALWTVGGLRYVLTKLNRAKAKEENAEWIRSMYERWLR